MVHICTIFNFWASLMLNNFFEYLSAQLAEDIKILLSSSAFILPIHI